METSGNTGRKYVCFIYITHTSTANAGNARDSGSIPGSGRPLEKENGNPLQCSCLENPMDREAWWAIVHKGLRVGHD